MQICFNWMILLNFLPKQINQLVVAAEIFNFLNRNLHEKSGGSNYVTVHFFSELLENSLHN